MKSVYFDEKKHFDLLRIWWHERKFPQIPVHLLPQTGLVVESDDGVPICAGFMFRTDSPVAIINHLVSDPTYEREARSMAVDLLIMDLVGIAKSMGYLMVTGATNLSRLTERYQKLGFKCYDDRVTHVALQIEPCL